MIEADKVVFTMILLDLFIFGLIILFAFGGFKRGGLKAFLSLIWLFIAFAITSLFYERLSLFIQAMVNISSTLAQVICFAVIFIFLSAITRIADFMIKKLLLKPKETKSISSGVIGAVFGAIEGIFIVSIIVMNIAFFPIKSPVKDAISYRTFRHVAPEIRDLTVGRIPYLKDLPLRISAPEDS